MPSCVFGTALREPVMIDEGVREQLKSVFTKLEGEVTLSHDESPHEKQAELLELLKDVASASSKIKVTPSGKTSLVPQFAILSGNSKTGIKFKGIPGGHEFTSLILAILNSDGKGKMPDASLSGRVKAIKGPVRIRTYISLSCENCPNVVQTLNQMALIHPDFEHEMIDGAFAEKEIEQLGIQGVPAVIVGENLLHSGKIEFLDLLTKLEENFGTEATATNVASMPQDLGAYDVVVIGGGPAGASAAIYSSRKGLKTVLLTERLGGQVQDTKGIENLISVPYTEGPQLSAQLYQHVAAYPITVLDQRRVAHIQTMGTKKIILESGEFLTTESVIVTTGAKWRELGIPGEREYIGRGVAFCPHCDGPFYKGKKVAVIGGGNSGVEAAIDLASMTSEVVLFEFQDKLKADEILIKKLKSLPNVTIVTNAKTKQILGNGQKVIGMEYEDRASGVFKSIELDGVFVQIGLLPNSSFLKGVVDLTPFGEIVVDQKGRTSVPGVYAAGDVTTTPYKQIVIAIGEGAKTALAAFEDRMRASG
jgi:alkyl hydroperoxide reductase subunit F